MPNLRTVPFDNGDQPPDPELPFANNPMTLAWQNAPDRETGADAVVELRARRLRKLEAEKQRGGWNRFRRRPHDAA